MVAKIQGFGLKSKTNTTSDRMFQSTGFSSEY